MAVIFSLFLICFFFVSIFLIRLFFDLIIAMMPLIKAAQPGSRCFQRGTGVHGYFL